MSVRHATRGAATLIGTALTAALLTIPATTAQAAEPTTPGAVLDVAPLSETLKLANAGTSIKMTYATTDTFGKAATSTGMIYLPAGPAPAGGWPIMAWAHGTTGLGDSCAPTNAAVPRTASDTAYFDTWLKNGYAIVASDFVGLGTPGLPAYLDGRTTAHNIVDMVKASRTYTGANLPAASQLSNKWTVVGHSQGGGAAIYTARYASEFGGPGLDYRGAASTGTPAHVEDLVSIIDRGFPPIKLTPGLASYAAYIFASLRTARPELKIDDILTPEGKAVLSRAETMCTGEFQATLQNAVIGDWFTAPVKARPGWKAITDAYLKMPERGFDKPFFMGHGLTDISVPFLLTAPYVLALTLNGQPLTFKTYVADHAGTFTQAEGDVRSFVARLMR